VSEEKATTETMTIRVSIEVGNWLRKMAERREETLQTTADRILKTARGRLQALDTYAKKQKAAANGNGKKKTRKGK